MFYYIGTRGPGQDRKMRRPTATWQSVVFGFTQDILSDCRACPAADSSSAPADNPLKGELIHAPQIIAVTERLGESRCAVSTP